MIVHREIFLRGIRNGLKTSLLLIKVVIPFYILMNILKETTSLISYAADFFSPIMKYHGLPGDAAMAILAGYLVNLYAAIAVMIPLGLNPKQITILGLLLGLSHNLIVETMVLREIKTNYLLFLGIRVSLSLIIAFTINQII